jgi:radical SAM-linked protein
MSNVRQKLWIRFRKTGELRLIGHRDLARAFERLFRRAALPLAMSQGFHPHAKINFPSALALGIQGDNELVEVSLAEAVDEQAVRARLVEQSPDGLEITDVQAVSATYPKPRIERMSYQIPVPERLRAAVEQAIDRLLSAERRDEPSDPGDWRSTLDGVRFVGERLEFSLRATEPAQTHPRDVLAALGLADLQAEGVWLIRSDVHFTHPPMAPGDGSHVLAPNRSAATRPVQDKQRDLNEERNVDQRGSAGRMPDRHC